MDGTAKDVSKLSSSDDQHLMAMVPLSAIKVAKPPDGNPSTEDWITTTISFLFQGSRLHREPLDLYALDPENVKKEGTLPDEPFLGVKKGFTRLMLPTC